MSFGTPHFPAENGVNKVYGALHADVVSIALENGRRLDLHLQQQVPWLPIATKLSGDGAPHPWHLQRCAIVNACQAQQQSLSKCLSLSMDITLSAMVSVSTLKDLLGMVQRCMAAELPCSPGYQPRFAELNSTMVPPAGISTSTPPFKLVLTFVPLTASINGTLHALAQKSERPACSTDEPGLVTH